MIGWIAARTGLDRFVVFGLLTGLVLAASGVAFWRGMVAIERLQTTAAAAASEARDAYWSAQLAQANAAAERLRSEQSQAVAMIEARAAGDTLKLQTELNELEKANAELANGDRCGLERDRVRLLDGAR